MKITGFMVCGPNEKYLERSLKEFKRLCDDALIATNNADEITIALIEKYGYKYYEDNREWGIYQPTIKTDLLKKVAELKPDWIVAIDADEVFAPEFDRKEAERLASLGEIAYYFMVVNLYNDDKHFAHDVGIQRFWNIRFYKFLPEYGLQFLKRSLHCGLAPPYAYKYGWHAPYYLLHYGLMLPEDRDRKAKRYARFDPKAIFKDRTYYDDLKKDLKMREFDSEGLLKQLSESKECQPRNSKIMPSKRPERKFAYVKNKAGAVLDIPLEHLEETLKRPGMSFVGYEDKMKEEIEELFKEETPEPILQELPKEEVVTPKKRGRPKKNA